MSELKEIVNEKQERRYKLLLELWKAVEGKEYKNVDFMQIAKETGFDEDEAQQIYYYFMNEDFFSSRRVRWGVSLSHKAIIEIENSIDNPHQSTEHFPSTVIQNFHAPVGAVQTGNQNIANVNQNIGQSFSEILEQLAILRNQFQNLPNGESEEAIEIIVAIEVEVQSEKPSKGKIKSFLLTTRDFAVKTGTELAASTLAKLIESQIGIKG